VEILSFFNNVSLKWCPPLSMHCWMRPRKFCITLTSIPWGIRQISSFIVFLRAGKILGRCLYTSALRYPIENNRRVQCLVIVLAKGRRHVKKWFSYLELPHKGEFGSVSRKHAGRRQQNNHLPEMIQQRKHVLHQSTAWLEFVTD